MKSFFNRAVPTAQCTNVYLYIIYNSVGMAISDSTSRFSDQVERKAPGFDRPMLTPGDYQRKKIHAHQGNYPIFIEMK